MNTLARRPGRRCVAGARPRHRVHLVGDGARSSSGNATPAQIAGFAVALRSKGETQAEMQGLVDAMYRHAAPMEVEGRVVDIVGTGGDRARTVNISTMAAVSIAGAGVRVVKHGNRAPPAPVARPTCSRSSASGWTSRRTKLGEVLDAVGITFCFAPVFHASFRFAGRAARSSASPRRSTSWARWSTRPGRTPWPSALPTRGWRRSWPACSRAAAPTPSSSAATTGSTRSPPPRRRASGRAMRHGSGHRARSRPAAARLRAGPSRRADRWRRGVQRRRLRAGHWTARSRPCATPCCSTPPPASPRSRPPTASWRIALAAGIERARESIDSGAGRAGARPAGSSTTQSLA